MKRLIAGPLWALLVVAACGDSAGAPDAAVLPDADVRGTFSFAWTLEDPDGNPLDCEDVNALSVRLEFRNVDSTVGMTDPFPCAAGIGQPVTTRGIAPATYALSFVVSTTEGDLAAPVTMNNVVLAPSSNQDLGTVTFVIDPTGSFSFQLRAFESTGGNCAAVDPDDGAEIATFQLVLEDADGNCVGTVFDIAAGADTPAATYDTTACDGAVFNGCIESDQVITVSDIGSGPHTLEITGSRAGDLPCYVTTSQFAIPGNNLTKSLGTINIPVDADNEACVPPSP